MITGAWPAAKKAAPLGGEETVTLPLSIAALEPPSQVATMPPPPSPPGPGGPWAPGGPAGPAGPCGPSVEQAKQATRHKGPNQDFAGMVSKPPSSGDTNLSAMPPTWSKLRARRLTQLDYGLSECHRRITCALDPRRRTNCGG